MLRISFNLGDRDLQHFEAIAHQTQAIVRTLPYDAIIAAAREVLDQAERAQLADFVRERFSHLRTILEMATDAQWPLSEDDRQRVINALAYFSTPAGGNATFAATVGFLDHAIMMELVSRDLEHDLAAYRDFCKLRDARSEREDRLPATDREQWLHQRREVLQQRMHARRQRSLNKAAGPVRRLFSLFRL